MSKNISPTAKQGGTLPALVHTKNPDTHITNTSDAFLGYLPGTYTDLSDQVLVRGAISGVAQHPIHAGDPNL